MTRVQVRLSTSNFTWIKDAKKTPLGRGMAVTTLLGVTTGVTTGVITLLAVATWAVITSAVAGSAVFCWQRVGPSGNAVLNASLARQVTGGKKHVTEAPEIVLQ